MMEAILRVTYTVYSGLAEQNTSAGEEVWTELRKDFDLPFAPIEGTRLMFTPIKTNHEHADTYTGLLEQAPELATGIFTAHAVTYNVTRQCFYIDAAEAVETLEVLQSITRQLVVGYGFAITGSSEERF